MMLKKEPEVFIFDLDFTIWNAGDTFCSETNPPYQWKNDKLFDCSGRWIRLYPEVLSILKKLREKKKIVAVASRTHQPEWALELLRLFGLNKYIDIFEIYRGEKTNHIKAIHEKLKFPYNQMVFFDDEKRNIEDAETLGVIAVMVENGLTAKIIEEFQ
jgi:magnesium-dependent phosphatase 1